jgi:hypothetical protein
MARPLWQILLETFRSDSIELSCQECVTVLEYLADLGAAGLDKALLESAARRHLSHCSDCYQEFVRHLLLLEAQKDA